MSFALDITDCFASEIGDSGLEEATFEQYLQKNWRVFGNSSFASGGWKSAVLAVAGKAG